MNNYEYYTDENGVYEFPTNVCQKLHIKEHIKGWERTGLKKGYGNAGVGIRIKNHKLDYNAFEKAIERVINENDQLRAICVEKDGEYYQKIIKHIDFKLKITEAEGNTFEGKVAFATALAKKICERPYDIFNELSYEFSIIKISDDDNIFMASAHHWIGDGTSLGIIFNEVLNYYLHPDTPHEEKSMFIDFVREIEEFAKTPKGEKQKEYWAEEFAGYEKFDFDKINMGEPSDGIDKSFVIPMSAIDEASRKYKATRFCVFHMALHVAVSLFTGKYDTVIGATSANRSLKYMKCVGFFARPVPIRINIKDDDDKLLDLLNITSKKFSKGLSNLKTADFLDILPFINPYQNFIPSGNKVKQEIESEKLKFPLERTFDIGFVQVVESDDKLIVIMSGNGSIVTNDFIKALQKYLPAVFELLAENENATVADVKKYCEEK